jgi:hypothetical protein
MRKTTTLVAGIATLGLAASGAAASTHDRAGATPARAAGGTPPFTARVTNRWFPLHPGMRWEYRGMKDGRHLLDIVRVTGRVERIAGAPCAVVDDRSWLDGRLSERTTDWYTQDAHGTVWYYGERTAELDRHGHVTSREGSWRAGVAGARGGVFMPAVPRVGASFAQEHARGAQDRFRIVRRNASVTVPYRAFRGTALETREFTPLEPGVREGKWYVAGIGEVREAALRGPVEHAELVAFRR